MQANSLYLTAPYQLEWMTEELPPLKHDEVLIKTLAGSISIGTELQLYRGQSRGEDAYYPRMTGYESYGEIIATGSSVNHPAIGDKVIAFYGHRSHAIRQRDEIIPVPADVSPQQALLAILSCDVCKALRKLDLKPEKPVLITGGGAIGLLTVCMLGAYGVQQVDLIEPDAYRRKIGQELGASHTWHPDDLPKYQSYLIGIECSSRQSAFAQLQSALRPHGQIAVLADGNIEALILTPDFHRKELHIIGSSDGWDYRLHSRWYFEYLRQTKLAIETIFDTSIKPQELAQTFADLADGLKSSLKVFVDDYSS